MTIASRTLAALVAAAALLLIVTPARAQSVEAEALFREGKRLMKDGQTAQACDKFEASNRLESSVGTLLNLADCREKNHQLATAWATFLKASAAAKQAGNDPKREAEARRRASALEARLAYLTISVPDASRVEGLVVKRNGAPVDPALWNQGVPVDAGEYEISGQAPGHEPWSTKVQITADGQKISVEVPRFKRLEDLQPAVTPANHAAPVATATPGPATEPTAPVDEHDEGPGMFTPMRKGAVAAIAVGVGGIVVGSIFGSKANDLEKQSDAICPQAACNDPHALDLNKSARSDATIANVGFIGGGVALAAGAALWFLGAPKVADHPVAITPVVRGDQVGVSIGGSF
jgi:hypothetical protein